MNDLDPDILAQAVKLAHDNPQSMVAVFESATGTYLYASPSHLRLMGYQPAELLGTSLSSYHHPDDLEHSRLALMDAVLHGKSVEVGVRLLHKNGRPLRVRATADHMVSKGGQDLILGRATPVEDTVQ